MNLIDKEQISENLKEIIEKQLSNNFKNRKSQKIIKVIRVRINKFEIDENIRNKINIFGVTAKAEVMVESVDGSYTNDEITLQYCPSIKFYYDESVQKFNTQNDNIVFLDIS